MNARPAPTTRTRERLVRVRADGTAAAMFGKTELTPCEFERWLTRDYEALMAWSYSPQRDREEAA